MKVQILLRNTIQNTNDDDEQSQSPIWKSSIWAANDPTGISAGISNCSSYRRRREPFKNVYGCFNVCSVKSPHTSPPYLDRQSRCLYEIFCCPAKPYHSLSLFPHLHVLKQSLKLKIVSSLFSSLLQLDLSSAHSHMNIHFSIIPFQLNHRGIHCFTFSPYNSV